MVKFVEAMAKGLGTEAQTRMLVGVRSNINATAKVVKEEKNGELWLVFTFVKVFDEREWAELALYVQGFMDGRDLTNLVHLVHVLACS